MLNFQQITMPYLASFVPRHWEVIHIDEAVTPVDVALQVDLVGITFHPRAHSMHMIWLRNSADGAFRWY